MHLWELPLLRFQSGWQTQTPRAFPPVPTVDLRGVSQWSQFRVTSGLLVDNIQCSVYLNPVRHLLGLASMVLLVSDVAGPKHLDSLLSG